MQNGSSRGQFSWRESTDGARGLNELLSGAGRLGSNYQDSNHCEHLKKKKKTEIEKTGRLNLHPL